MYATKLTHDLSLWYVDAMVSAIALTNNEHKGKKIGIRERLFNIK